MNGCGCHDPRVFGHVHCQIEGAREAWKAAETARRDRIRQALHAAIPQRYAPENTCYFDTAIRENGGGLTVIRAAKHIFSP